MSAPQYTVLTLDLAVARTATPIVEVGRPISSVCVLALPAGIAAALGFGTNKPFVPLLTQGQSFEDICPLLDEGLFMTNPVAAGFLILYIGFESGFNVVGT